MEHFIQLTKSCQYTYIATVILLERTHLKNTANYNGDVLRFKFQWRKNLKIPHLKCSINASKPKSMTSEVINIEPKKQRFDF